MNAAERKKHLIAQGAIYRAEVMLSKHALQASLQPDALARGALQQLTLGVMSVFGKRGSGGMPGFDLQTVLPIAITAFGALSKSKGLLKTLLRGVAVAGATAGAVALLSRRKRPSRDANAPRDAGDNTG